MTSNYPPGMTGGITGSGAYAATCPDHGLNIESGWEELGGLFIEEVPPPRGVALFDHNGIVCPEDCRRFEDLTWEPVDARRCPRRRSEIHREVNPVQQTVYACGAWATQILSREHILTEEEGVSVIVTRWLCPEGHETQTEEI